LVLRTFDPDPSPQGRARVILSLFDYTGEWAQPYVNAGESVLLVDILHEPGLKTGRPSKLGADLTTTDGVDLLLELVSNRKITGILAAPPCDAFTRASAWLWKKWDADGTTNHRLKLVDITLDLVEKLNPDWWVMENPPGRLYRKKGGGLRQDVLGDPVMQFDPWQYGAHAPEDPSSRRTKRTYLWGSFTPPIEAEHPDGVEPYPAHLPPRRRDPIRQMGSRNKTERARTPPGFAKAFFLANR